MSSRLLARTRPRLTNTPSLSESSDPVVASVVHTISLSGQPTSPEPDLHDIHSSPTTTLSDLISRRIQADLVSNSAQSAVSQALRTVSSMSPIAPRHTMTQDNSGISDAVVDISIARTAGNLPPWHQHYRAGPLELLAVPHNKTRQPADKIPEDIAPSVHLNHHDVLDTKFQRPITAKYLPTAGESLAENNETSCKVLNAHTPPGRMFPHAPNQTPPPYAISPALNKAGIQETLSSFSNDSVDLPGVIAHVDRDTKTVPLPTGAGQVLSITRTVLANRIPAPAAIQPSYFDRATSSPSIVPSGIIPVISKPELLPMMPSAKSAPSIDQRELNPNESATSPDIVEIVSVKNSYNDKQEPEPLSVLIQKAILRQHKEKLDKAPDKMTEIAARAQQMKNAYDIENRLSQPASVLTPCFGQANEHLSSVTFSNSNRESNSKTDQSISTTQTSAKPKVSTKSKRRSSKKPCSKRSSSTESSSSSYYYSSYSEDSNEKVKWLSLGKDLANYPLYVTKYAPCGKCQHKAGILSGNHPIECASEALKQVDAQPPPSDSPSLEPQLNYLHRSSLTRIAPKDITLEASLPSAQLVVHQAAPQHSYEDNCTGEPVHAHQITRLQHTIAQKRTSAKESGPQAKEIIVTAIRRPEVAPASNTPIADNLAHASNHIAPTVDLNYNASGFTIQDPDSTDYNEVLFVLSREKSSACIDSTPSSTPYSTRGRLPPRTVKDLSPPISTPAYNSASIQQEVPNVSKKVTPHQAQPSEKHSIDSREEVQAILAHPFRPSGAPIVAKPVPKTPSDLSYLSCVNNIMDLHSVSAVSDTPERFQHYHSDSSIMGGSLQHASSYLSPNQPFYIAGGLFTPDMREETFSNLEEGEIPPTYQHIHERFLPLATPMFPTIRLLAQSLLSKVNMISLRW